MKFNIGDDSGLLAIVDPDKYKSFVDEDWTWEMINQHFINEMKNHHMLIWGTGLELEWKIEVNFQRIDIEGFQNVTGIIEASKGRLLLTSYDNLTMAAQFLDIKIPGEYKFQNILTIDPGIYDCRIIQLSDPKSNKPFEEPLNFIYEINKNKNAKEPWNKIPWMFGE
jgi:hypothetical protein